MKQLIGGFLLLVSVCNTAFGLQTAKESHKMSMAHVAAMNVFNKKTLTDSIEERINKSTAAGSLSCTVKYTGVSYLVVFDVVRSLLGNGYSVSIDRGMHTVNVGW